jgi:hypothetical protein
VRAGKRMGACGAHGPLFMLPVRGSDTQWYRNVLKNPQIRIDARGAEAEYRAVLITEAKTVKSVVEKFREKYGATDVKKYYSKFDVAVLVEINSTTRHEKQAPIASHVKLISGLQQQANAESKL